MGNLQKNVPINVLREKPISPHLNSPTHALICLLCQAMAQGSAATPTCPIKSNQCYPHGTSRNEWLIFIRQQDDKVFTLPLKAQEPWFSVAAPEHTGGSPIHSCSSLCTSGLFWHLANTDCSPFPLFSFFSLGRLLLEGKWEHGCFGKDGFVGCPNS